MDIIQQDLNAKEKDWNLIKTMVKIYNMYCFVVFVTAVCIIFQAVDDLTALLKVLTNFNRQNSENHFFLVTIEPLINICKLVYQ